ncbi:MAG: anaerobic sulfatase maturase [Acidobacteria bacterium]|nr:MAG: anaerobic sulfatase maturase [Acidobacteriota bacterium]
MPRSPVLPSSRPADAPPALHVLAKPSGPICNLACTYCFFLEKEEMYPGDRFRMSDEVLENYIRQQFESQSGPVATLAWQGGEPTLMGLDFFERAVDFESKHNTSELHVERAIQTNGTLLDDQWCEFLAANQFLVGISIDGPSELHDAYRVDKRGEPTHAKALRGLELLRKHKVEFNILCTVHEANSAHPTEVYRYFRDELGARFIQFIPIVERLGRDEGVTDESVRPEAWGEFLCAVFDEWVRNDVGTVFVQSFDAALASWVGVPPGVCIFNETCGNGLALAHNGDVYSCDHFVDPDHLLGNLTETHLIELAARPEQVAFGLDKRDGLPKYCLDCDVRFACHGECPKNRFGIAPNGDTGLNYLCEGYRRFFRHIDAPMRAMARLYDMGKPPAVVMAMVAEADAAIEAAYSATGRNDPCPCGSGAKYKHCHGSHGRSASQRPAARS